MERYAERARSQIRIGSGTKTLIQLRIGSRIKLKKVYFLYCGEFTYFSLLF